MLHASTETGAVETDVRSLVVFHWKDISAGLTLGGGLTPHLSRASDYRQLFRHISPYWKGNERPLTRSSVLLAFKAHLVNFISIKAKHNLPKVSVMSRSDQTHKIRYRLTEKTSLSLWVLFVFFSGGFPFICRPSVDAVKIILKYLFGAVFSTIGCVIGHRVID